MHVVKIYLQEGTPVTGQAAALYVGDEWIKKYFAFEGGIFFNVYDRLNCTDWIVRTIMGEDAAREIWVCGPAAYIVLKALAFSLRARTRMRTTSST